MRNQHTSIIPINQTFYNKKINEIIDWEVKTTNSIYLEAIASFCFLVFMLDDQTYFEDIVNTSTQGKSILLPISGGLDSRSLFVPIRNRSDVISSSYDFENGFESRMPAIIDFHCANFAGNYNRKYRGRSLNCKYFY